MAALSREVAEARGLVGFAAFSGAKPVANRRSAPSAFQPVGENGWLTPFLPTLSVFLLLLVPNAESAQAAGPASAPLGSAEFQPSPERPLGWRGDGSGRYPGAVGPVSWERRASADGYATRGILWMTPLPNIGVSSPIVVGDRIFLTSEVSDLVCIDKQTGRILWLRSNLECEGLPEETRQTNAAYADKLAPLLKELTAANTAVVEALNARLATAPTAPFRPPEPAFKRKRDLEKQIQDQQLAIDKKLFGRYWAQAVFGFSGPTPTSDGQRVCAFFTTGVTACYDLEGRRQWITRGAGGGSEHGNFASPLLCENRLVVWANEMRAYDVASGKLAWSNPARAYNTYGSLFRLQSGQDQVACFQWGFFARIRDGQPVWEQGVFGDTVTTPIVEGDTLFARVGYPRNNDEAKGFKAFKIPVSTTEGKFKAAYDFKADWAEDELAIDKKKNPFDRGFVASPLYVDGLIYQLTQGGGLMVNEAASGALVYRKVLPLKPRTQYWDWSGCAASPTLGGKHIYLMDNQGTTLLLQPGREYRVIAQNFLAETRDGKEQAQNVSTPVFVGTRMYYRTPGYLYCIGEK
jgi:outer membrane protein assembly factor BamB